MARRLVMVLAAIGLLFATACSSTSGEGPGGEQRFTVAGDESITVTAGSTFQIALAANRTTPYEWTQRVDGSAVRAEGQSYEGPDSDLDGAGGTEVFTYRAVEAGTATIDFAYVEVGSDEATQQYTVTVDVT